MSSTNADRDPYWFSAFPFPAPHFRVVAVRGRETLNRPYAFDVTVTAPAVAGEGLERQSVGQRARLVMRVGATPRVVPGFIESVRMEGLRESGTTSQATFRLVPMLALLRHQRRSRIFQDMRVDQVVDEVLRAAGIATRWRLKRTEPPRAYITQYEESDLELVERLLGEAGISYCFAMVSGASGTLLGADEDAVSGRPVLRQSAEASFTVPEETVVFTDDPAAYPRMSDDGDGPAPTLSYATADGPSTGRYDEVTAFVAAERVRAEVAEYRDFDPSRPLTPLSSRIGDSYLPSVPAIIGGPAAAPIAERVADVLNPHLSTRGLETYEHHGYFLFPDVDDAGVLAGRIRTRRTKKRSTARGESNCNGLTPGHRFRLDAHPVADQNREHVVVSVDHRGQVAKTEAAYRCSFRSVPASVLYPPSRRRQRTVPSLLTATVVGPPGEDIHVDTEGRIRVRFHWDRRTPSAHSSCWIRTVQPWAGAAFGHQFIPRVGMEVAVTFEGGDPDKPVVIGSLYNKTHPAPFALPEKKTQSGVRTQSTPGGEGFNELMFEDAKGREKVYLQAERDLDELIKHDMQTHVLANQQVNIGAQQSVRVGETRRLDVVGDHVERVAESHSELVGANKSTEIGETRRLVVHGDDHESVRGTRTTTVDGRLNVHAAEHCGLTVGDSKKSATVNAYAYGTLTVGADGAINLTSMSGISLVCGETVLAIDKDGITLKGSKLSLKAEKSLTAEGAGPSLVLDENVLLTSKTVRIVARKSSLVLNEDAHLDGTRVLLNCKNIALSRATSRGAPPKTKRLSLKLTDAAFVAYGGKPYILAAGGASLNGTTDGDGKVEQDIPEHATHAELVLFLGGYPDGERRRYTIQISDAVEVSEVRGVLSRLQNLGYYFGEIDDVLRGPATFALKQFQRDHKLEATGELDDATVAQLRERHGH